MTATRPGFRDVLPRFGWPETVVVAAILLQIIASASLIIYFLLVKDTCTPEHCEVLRFITLTHINEDSFVRVLKGSRALYMFYNIFIPASYAYLATTILLLVLMVARFRRFLAFRARLLLVACLAAYLYFVVTALMFPPLQGTLARLDRQITTGDTAGYFILFCIIPLLSIFFATGLSWKSK
jgi:hypothetical protein